MLPTIAVPCWRSLPSSGTLWIKAWKALVGLGERQQCLRRRFSKAVINTATYKYLTVTSREYSIPYIILDEGWYQGSNCIELSFRPSTGQADRLRQAKMSA